MKRLRGCPTSSESGSLRCRVGACAAPRCRKSPGRRGVPQAAALQNRFIGHSLPIAEQYGAKKWNDAMRLKGKAIAIIGGTTGMGLSAARAMRREGAKLLLVGRSADSIDRARAELGDGVETLAGDATHSETADQAVALAVERFGKLDGLYHVAGGSGRRFGDGPLHELTDEGWRKTCDLNLSSLIWSNRAAARQFLAQGTGGAFARMRCRGPRSRCGAFAGAPARNGRPASDARSPGLRRAGRMESQPRGLEPIPKV